MKKVFSNRIVSVFFSVLASVMAVTLVGYAVSTISTSITTDGTLRVTGTFTAKGTADFDSTSATTTISGGLRADTGDNTLVVDFSSSRVGIGTTSPSVLFSVQGAAILGSADADVLAFRSGTWQLTSTATTTITTSMGVNINAGDLVLDTASTTGLLYVGTSTPKRGNFAVDGTGTTTLVVSTTAVSPTGTCIELNNATNGGVMKIYATSSDIGTLRVEPGVCY